MSATPEVPPVETIPLGLGFDAYGITRGDILARVSEVQAMVCLLYTSPSPRDGLLSRMPSSA